MGTEQSAEQVRSEHIEKLGRELGSQYNLLYNEVISISLKFNEFKYLYSESDSRIAIMNKTAPFFFFKVLQKILWENILLGICRITDPPKSAGKKNITIQNLSTLVHDKELQVTIENKVFQIIVESEFCRDWRNRWISHFDYDLNLNEGTDPIKDATILKVKVLMKSIYELFNLIQNRFFKSTVMFDDPIVGGCSSSLIAYLEIGLETENKVRKI